MIYGISNQVKFIHKFHDYSIVELTNDLLMPINPVVTCIIDGISNRLPFEKLPLLLKKTFNLPNQSEDQLLEAISDFVSGPVGSILLSKFVETEPLTNTIKTGINGKQYPVELSVELTSTCNLYCHHCYKKADSKISHICTDKFMDFMNSINNKVAKIHFTGGEPLLHPDFEQITKFASERFFCKLSSNGLKISEVSEDVLRNFEGISLSLYGLSDTQYKERTGNPNGYTLFKNSCMSLRKLEIPFTINIVLNKNNFTELENYVKQAIEFGAKVFHVGQPLLSGRLFSKSASNDPWMLNLDEIRSVYRLLRILEVKYRNSINILQWQRDVYSNKTPDNFHIKNLEQNHCFICGAGSTRWTLTENLMLKPCPLLSHEDFVISDLDKFDEIVSGNLCIDWAGIRTSFVNKCSTMGVDSSSVCERITL